MKRLIKKSNEEFTYKFKSPITVNYGDEFTFKAETYDLNSVDNDTIALVKESVENSIKDLGPKGLAEYLDENKSYASNIESILVTVDGGNAITTVKSNKELDDNELDDIAEYITGQFSDGWGEGFEQEVLDSWTETSEDEVWDEEEQEIVMETSEYTVTLSASLWNHKDWHIELV